MAVNTCLICGSRRWEGLLRLRSVPSFTGCSKSVDAERRQLKIVFCKECGLIMKGEPLSFNGRKNKNKIYYPSTKVIQQKRKEDGDFYDFLQKQGISFRNILEIGCHDGHFLSLFKSSKCRLFGCEPSYYAKLAEKKRNITVKQEPFSAGLYKGKKFDLIIMRNLLNVVRNPSSMIKEAVSLLEEGGFLAVENINVREFLRQDVIPRFSGELIYYPSIGHIRILLVNAGLDILKEFDGRRVYFFAKKAFDEKVAKHRRSFRGHISSIRKYKHGYLKHVMAIKRKFDILAGEWKKKGLSVAFFGAGSFAQALLSSLDIKETQISSMIDSDPLKKGNYLKGTGLKISHVSVLKKRHFDIIAISSFYQKEIIGILKRLNVNSKVLVFHPEIKYITLRRQPSKPYF